MIYFCDDKNDTSNNNLNLIYEDNMSFFLDVERKMNHTKEDHMFRFQTIHLIDLVNEDTFEHSFFKGWSIQYNLDILVCQGIDLEIFWEMQSYSILNFRISAYKTNCPIILKIF